ncbi:hypothetical protein PT520_11930 [Aliarcobacter butzleri]|uniref:Uncharacterized protein n=1 Tax=Aliarcobacter butzleri TaxID=28197 RepID=A0AAW6VTM4_9BACT|nr:hypothetical protein [Aliarcobacter butzleri]MDK2063226.1 hypothetical protein [Aliarcobacter butzleri]MDK2071148.1 hypothetical protein [Aliarcobacter butzleri]
MENNDEITLSEARRITADFKAAVIKLDQIQKNQNLLFETFQEIVHKDNKFFMDKAFVYRALDQKEIQVLEKIKQFDQLNSRLARIEKNAFQELENSILSIKNNDFFEPLKFQIKKEQLNFEKELKETKKLITEKLAFLKLEVFEFNTNISEQIKSVELSKDIINKKHQNYVKDMELRGQELLNSFKKIEVNRDKNLKLVLYITAGISITTLIICGAILFKLFKLFH